MRIAFIIYQGAVITGKSNGIRSQAYAWSKILCENGIECVLVNNWDNYNWSMFDAVHIFGYDISIYNFVKSLFNKNKNIFISPIIDSDKNYNYYKFATYNGFEKLRLYSINYSLKKALKIVKGVCGRSNHEIGYYLNSFGIEAERIFKIPLSYGIEEPQDLDLFINKKESFCLHISSLYQDRKNVIRLVRAALKYNFKLVLAGDMGTEKDFAPIRTVIGESKNILVLGYISSEKLIELYRKAKVFALPSLNEGVGIVALDAAIYGCNILITNISGPKEYYPCSNNVEIIDPYDIDNIGLGVIKLLNVSNNEELNLHISKHYSKKSVYSKLINMYTNI